MISLFSLPAELLADLTAILAVEDIVALWMAGDSRLNNRLKRGGVTSLQVSDPLTFPRIVGELRLKSFQLRLDYHYSYRSNRFIPGIELGLLGSDLEKLDLDFRRALAKLALLGPIGPLFPNLKSLKLPSICENPVNFDDVGFLGGLPVGLLHLSLPSNVAMGVGAILSLPCHLATLKIGVKSMSDEQERAFRDASIFTQLTELLLSYFLTFRWPLVVPSSVVHYTAIFQRGARGAHPYAETAEELEQLPPHLTHLSVSSFPLETPSLLQYLPNQLQHLEICNKLPKTTPITEIWRFLPKSITRLNLPFSDFHPDRDAIFDIPKQLIRWLQFPMETYVSSHQQPPPNLIGEDLFFSEFFDSNIPFLPSSVTSLYLMCEPNLTAQGLVQLPVTLTNLTITDIDLDPAFLRHLPKQLIYLEIEALDFNSDAFEDHEWQHVWPRRLKRLRLVVSLSGALFGPCFWRYFPSSLKALHVYVVDTSNLPSNFAFLPRALKAFSMKTHAVEGRARPNLLTDAFFTQMPPTLLELLLEGFNHDLTPSFCLQLPKRLGLLHVRPRATFPDPAVLPQFDTPELRPPLVWEYLDSIPRFLHLDLYFAVPFTALLALRQMDDLLEDCPNVAISPHDAGSGRPNTTPRRNTKQFSQIRRSTPAAINNTSNLEPIPPSQMLNSKAFSVESLECTWS